MPRRLIIHIGMSKTGSTALQAAFKGYDRDGVFYADLPHVNHSLDFATAFAPGLSAALRDKSPKDILALRRRAQARIRDEALRDKDLVIFSGEKISAFRPEAVAEMKKFFDTLGSAVHIVGYTRNPEGWTNSAVVERLKAGVLDGVPCPHYKNRFSPFLSTFGADAVTLRDYRPDEFEKGEISADFARSIGIAPPKALPRRVNERLTQEAADILFALKESGELPDNRVASEHVLRAAVSLLTSYGHTPFRLPPSAAASVDQPGSRFWLKRHFDIDYEVSDISSSFDLASFFRTPDWSSLREHIAEHTRLPPRSARPHDIVAALHRIGRKEWMRAETSARVSRAVRLSRRLKLT